MMTSQIADRLVELCRKGEFEAAQTELFAEDAVSIEPEGAPMEMAEGLAAIQEKGRQFMASVEQMHGIVISEPVVAGNFFTVSMALDTTFKGRGRVNMEELCVYEVDGGKIITEQFFYSVD
jgi:limonene-1,2-epoxide hydrolase